MSRKETKTMKKKQLFRWVMKGFLAGLMLALATSGTVRPDIAKASQNETIDSFGTQFSADDILQLLGDSTNKWNSVHVSYTINFKEFGNVEEISQTYQHEFWLMHDGRARLEISTFEGSPLVVWVRDDTSISEANYEKGTYTESSLPKSLVGLTEELNSNAFSAHLIPSGLNDYVFPQSLAESMKRTKINENAVQEILVIGNETIAGRQTVMVERKILDPEQPAIVYKLHRYWIDAETGIILKGEIEDLINGGWTQQFEAKKVEVNVDIPEETFVFVVDKNFETD